MKECDIFSGGQNILWPLLHTFRGSWPQPPGSTPLEDDIGQFSASLINKAVPSFTHSLIRVREWW